MISALSSEDVHKILEPLLLAVGISLVIFAGAIILLWRHGRRMKALEADD